MTCQLLISYQYDLFITQLLLSLKENVVDMLGLKTILNFYQIDFKEKYTSDDFMNIFREREKKLIEDLPNLKMFEAKQRFINLFNDCPIELHIDPFGLMEILKKQYSNWSEGDRKYKITINE